VARAVPVTRRTVAGLAAAILVVVLALPAAAQAVTKTVRAGAPPAIGPAFTAVETDVDAFFPRDVTIHVGDSIGFVTSAFHTVDLPGRGGRALPLYVPTGQPVTGVADAAGQPFWFDGRPQLQTNPVLEPGSWGRRIRYSARARVLSGLPPLPRVQPLRVTFTRTGRFTFHCDVHPRMTGTVRVVGARTPAPSKEDDARTVATQLARDLAIARHLPLTRPTRDVVDVGQGGQNGVDRLAVLPATTAVRVGQPVTFRVPARSRESHTVTFGPGPADDPATLLGALSASFRNPAAPLDPRAAYRSERPRGAPAAITPTLHGDGFWNSGILDALGSTPRPRAVTVTFAAPGVYEFFCLIHPVMHAVVAVT